MISETAVIQSVTNAMALMEFTHGGKVTCEAAEELLLLAVATIWRTAGAGRASERLAELSAEMARPPHG
jgi:hypothetical protein